MYFRKTIFFFLFAFLQFSVSQINYTKEIPLKTSNGSRVIIEGSEFGNSYPDGYSDVLIGTKTIEGQFTLFRLFIQWDLPDSQIPDGSHIDSVRLVMDSIRTSGSKQMEAVLFNIENSVYNTETSVLWNATTLYSDSIAFTKSRFFKIDKTYPAGSKFVQAVQNSLTRDLFTLGIRNISGELDTINGLNIKMAFYYTLPSKNVVLNQTFDGTPGDGAIYRWTDGTFSDVGTLPATIQSYIGGEEVLLADQLLYTNKKYHDWSISDSVENFQRIKIGGTTDSLISRFSEVTNNVTLKNYFSSKNQYMNTPISFKDPWLIDYADPDYGNNMRNRGMDAPFKERTSPFSPDTSYNGDVYQGVFLNQSGAPEWNPPYYSVRAGQTQTTTEHGESVTWHFQNWSGTSVTFQNAGAAETPVVFNAAGATAEAIYKGHLVSNKTTATGPNHSRVLARSRKQYAHSGGSQGTTYRLHMAYADGGEVWYSFTDEDAIIWSDEQRVSDGNGGNVYPSVATLNDVAHIAWARKTGNTCNILYRSYDRANNSWGAIQTVASFSSSLTPTPVIALTENPLRVMVMSTKGSNITGWLLKNGAWQDAGLNISGQPALSGGPQCRLSL